MPENCLEFHDNDFGYCIIAGHVEIPRIEFSYNLPNCLAL